MSREEFFEEKHLFVSGEDGYVRYRIPALAITNRGTILAFCEARKHTGHDTDQIDLYVRRSQDNGVSFEERRLIVSEEGWVCGNPAPIVDRLKQKIWLLFCKNRMDGDETAIIEGKAPRTVWVTYSEDEGESWSEAKEITAQIKRTNWSWYATGPCHGIQLRSGRLIASCNHAVFKERKVETDPHHSHVIYSDDHGESWHVGGVADIGTNESTIMEAEDGQLYLNSRNWHRLADAGNFRSISWSADFGMSFSPTVHDAALIEPICQASVCRFTSGWQHDRNRVIFSNPTGLIDGKRDRAEMRIRLSYDECRTWPLSRILHAGPAAYSDLGVTGDLNICCLYERGEQDSPYDTLTLARFNLEWLTQGRDKVDIEIEEMQPVD